MAEAVGPGVRAALQRQIPQQQKEEEEGQQQNFGCQSPRQPVIGEPLPLNLLLLLLLLPKVGECGSRFAWEGA